MYMYVWPRSQATPLPTKEWPGIHCLRMCERIARIYGTGSVNVSVNRLSHMARSSMETVYEYSKRRTKNQTFCY